MLVIGPVKRKNWLITSTTPGYAIDSGYSQRPISGAIGIATEDFNGASGLVRTRVDIQLYSSTNLVTLLTTITQASAGAVGNPAGLTFNHIVDAGADLLLVLLMTYGNSVPTFTQCLMGTNAMNFIGSAVNSYFGAAAYWIKNPTIGQITIAASGTEWYNNVSAVALNAAGAQNAAIRNSVFNSVQSHSHATISGDMIIDFLTVTGVETPTGGQTVLATSTPSNHLYTSKYPIVTGGTTVLAWSGPTTGLVHGSFVIAGS